MAPSGAVVAPACVVPGCIDAGACNFDAAANIDDGSCYFTGDSCDDGDEWTENDAYDINCDCTGDEIEQVFGCMDTEACNYNLSANVDDGSCEYVPLYPIIGSTSAVLLEETSYNYNATLGSTYQWTVENGAVVDGQGSNSITAVWSSSGTYDVTIVETMEHGCTGDPVVISVNVGVDNIQEQLLDSVTLYPNPASEELNISVSNNLLNSVYRMIDSNGKLISEGIIDSDITRIDLSDFSSGTYMMHFFGEDGNSLFVEKVVVE